MEGAGRGRGRGVGFGAPVFPQKVDLPEVTDEVGEMKLTPTTPTPLVGSIGTSIGGGRGRGLVSFPVQATSPTGSSASGQISPGLTQVRKHSPFQYQLFDDKSCRGRGMGRGSGAPMHLGRAPDPPPVGKPSSKEKEVDTVTKVEAGQLGDGSSVQEVSKAVSSASGSKSALEKVEAVERAKKEVIKDVVSKRGEKGKVAQFQSNFIFLKMHGNKAMVEYHVAFDPPLDNTVIRKRAIRAHTNIIGTVRMFDGHTLFLPSALPEEHMTLEGTHPGDPEHILTLTITYVKHSRVEDCVQFYNILFNRVMEELSMVQMRRNFYNVRNVHLIPQHKLEIWPGYCISVENQEGGLMLNLDSSHKVLRQETAWTVLQHIKKSGDANWKKNYHETMLSQVVLTRYNNHSYKVDDIVWDLTPASTFPRKKGGDITFVDYYRQQHKKEIQDLEQPLLLSKVKPQKNATNQEYQVVCLVPELCNMTGLTAEQTSNFQIMKDIAQFTRISPQQRMRAINEWICNVNENKKTRAILSDWNLSLDKQPVQIEGRIVAGPSITFSNRATLKEAGPDFSRESGNNCFDPIALQNWAILVGQREQELACRFVDTYKQVASSLGIKFTNGTVIVMKQTNVSEYSRKLKEITENKNEFQFVVVIMNSQRDDIYSAIKKFCLVTRPFPSQVILAKTLRNEKRIRSVMVKVALQINCKLGGAIWSLNIPMRDKIMIVGLDVYHDPSKRSPSITAMVAALSNNMTKYYSRVVVQKPAQEMVDAIRSTFVDALRAYVQTNGGPPDRILVFRDGISNSQLDTSVHHEAQQFLGALDSENINYKYFTFIVVQKRISERFFSIQNTKYDNPQPGSIIDSIVTRRYLYDFFLVSQLVRQGAVTPTHYIVAHDIGDVKPDLIQKFSYALSFMYFNWPGTIRVPSVCQYAHKLAYLVGQHVKAVPVMDMNTFLYYL